MTRHRAKPHDNLDEALREQQKSGMGSAHEPWRSGERDPKSHTDEQARRERSTRGPMPMEGRKPSGGSAMGRKKSADRG